MADKPILFSGPMVRAILDGRKTMTRRVIKPQPDESLPIGGACRYSDGDPTWVWQNGFDGSIVAKFERNPPFATGDRLWVRETFIQGQGVGGYAPEVDPDEDPHGPTIDVIYRATYDGAAGPWSPSIFMPRRCSRLTLTVTDVKVERVADISEEDAEAEGWPAPADRAVDGVAEIRDAYPIGWFAHLWDSINAAPKPRYAVIDGVKQITHYESYPWGGESRTETFRGKPHIITANPWVAAYAFETHHCNIDEMAG